MARRIAVVGGGWGGLAAAVAAVAAGERVTLFEAARTLGGRARSLEIALPDGRSAIADNGQHIMVGAYVETLKLMEQVGVRLGEALLRIPLVLRFPDGGGLALPDWPAPLDAAAGIATARGWRWGDRISLLRASTGWRKAGFVCAPGATVADLCRGIRPRVMAEMIEPLCVSALNTPAQRASGQVFLRVIRDALFGAGHRGWAGSNLLIPKQDLGRVFPHAAQAWLLSHGARLRLGRRVRKLAACSAHPSTRWLVDDEEFDAVILAAPPWEAARLVAESGVDAARWLRAVESLCYEAITTVYTHGPQRLALPVLALRSAPAQFVFDRGQLGGPPGLLAFVISASDGDRERLEQQVLAQAAELGWEVHPVQTVVEKRATFACTPGLVRPAGFIAPGLAACGDYVDGPYPATIEGAVRSARAALVMAAETDRTIPTGSPASHAATARAATTHPSDSATPPASRR